MTQDISARQASIARGLAHLEHSGVKGMKWGVRKDKPRGAIRRGATKANTALSAGASSIDKGEKSLIFMSQQNRNKAASATQTRVLGLAVRTNRDAQFKGKDLKKDPALKEAYYKRIEKGAVTIHREELAKVRTKAALELIDSLMDSRHESVSIRTPKPPAYQPKHKAVKHADPEMITILQLNFKKDSLDQVVGVEIEPASLEHSGVKGMKWGVRKADTGGAVTVSQRKPGGRVKASGGKGQPVHPDAEKAIVAVQKAKGSRTHSLSNAELKAANERMQLEENFNRLAAGKQSAGRQFAAKLLGNSKERNKAVQDVKQVTDLVQKIKKPKPAA